MMTTVFCIDFDETLSNTDRLRHDLVSNIRSLGGESLAAAYHEAYESIRAEHGVPRIPLILAIATARAGLDNETHRQLANLFHTFPYQQYLYPGAEQLVRHLSQQGSVVLFSDGDAFFQAHKINATSLTTLVDGSIILPNKTDYFDELAGFWPADHYVFVDDKHKVLALAKKHFGDKATTVIVQQGRYAQSDAASKADLSATSIAEVATLLPS